MGSLKMKTVAMVDMDCCVCGIDFQIPGWFQLRCHQSGEPFWCPAGHQQSYTKSENQRLRERVQRLESRNTHLEDQKQAAERSASAFKGQATQLRKRIANGVCPCCHRHFANVERHMKSKHPDFEGASV